MFNVHNSIQEMKKNENNHLMHPKSAPIKPDPDASAGPKSYGGHIYSMFQGDEASRQKKCQQQAYFQVLTRQIQEKKDPKSVDIAQNNNFTPEKNLIYAGNIVNDLIKHPFVPVDDEKKYSRYQKKYEIENHTGINVNTSQVFGGVLQRDEALLLKLKKEEQQKEMQYILNQQIIEKNRKKEEEKAWRRKLELNELEKVKTGDTDNVSVASPRKFIENICSPIVKSSEISSNSKTLQVFNKEEEEEVSNIESLNEVVKKLLEEKEALKYKVSEQEKKITELNKKETQIYEENGEAFEKISKNEGEKPQKIEKPKSRPPKSRIQTAQELKIKVQHDQERAKLALIEEKLENARKKRLEQSKSKFIQKPRRISEAQKRSDSRECLEKQSRIKTAASPIPKNQIFYAESPKTKQMQEYDRDNLDTAGKSNFIYPDANGIFAMEDEIDKFVTNYEKRESPLVNFKSPYRNNTSAADSESRFTFTSMTGNRRETKPLVANKQGFPSDIFRLP